MSNENQLVSLYRALSNTKFIKQDDTFSGHLILSEENVALIKSLNTTFPNVIYSLEINDDFIQLENLSDSYYGSNATITCVLPEKIFFKNSDDYVKEKNFKANGSLGFFYLIEENYVQGELERPEVIKKLDTINEVIEFLSKVLPHSQRGTSLVTFVYFPEDKNGNAKSKQLFSSSFSKEDLNSDLTSFIKLRETLSQNDCHQPERVTVFRNSLAEFFGEKSNNNLDSFSFMLNNFERLYEIYKDNYDTYINGFSLEKIKKEITDYHQQFSKAISDGMNEVVSKSLAIPASIAAGALLMRLDGPTGDLFMLVVLLLTAVITSMLLSWQKISIRDNEILIKKAFSSFTEDSKMTESAQIFSVETMESLLIKAKGVRSRVNWMFMIVWAPAIIASFFLFFKYNLGQTFLSFLYTSKIFIRHLFI